MSRDWQKDKRYLQELNNWEMDPDDEDLFKIATHYHQQYAAEKERGDKAEIAHKELKEYFDIKQQQVWLLSEERDAARAREQKLREAMEDIATYPPFEETNNGDRFYEQIREMAKELLSSLYPKEETKP